MQDNFQTEKCSENDVLEFKSGTYRIEKILQKIVEFKSTLAKQIHDSLNEKKIVVKPGVVPNTTNIDYSRWFDEGIDCEILKVGAKDWQKGKVRLKVTFEFIPDEPEETNNISESPLDGIRQITTNNSQ